MHTNIGICGSHRVGKTTLATAISKKHDIELSLFNSSAIFKQYWLSPAFIKSLKMRLIIQNKIFDKALIQWISTNEFIVTDRTPLDFLAYLLADINQKTTDLDYTEIEDYKKTCFSATNYLFSHIVLVQPGIPLKKAHNKGVLNKGYIEQLNLIIQGLCFDERLKSKIIVLPRHCLSLNSRLENITIGLNDNV